MENWKQISGTLDYEISDFGRIRRASTGRVLTVDTSTRYPSYPIPRLGRRNVHRLVLEAFVGPAPEGHEARHIDDVKTNCRLTNLAWGTRAENLADRTKNGIYGGPTPGSARSRPTEEFRTQRAAVLADREARRVAKRAEYLRTHPLAVLVEPV
jgi:hypothetical protein